MDNMFNMFFGGAGGCGSRPYKSTRPQVLTFKGLKDYIVMSKKIASEANSKEECNEIMAKCCNDLLVKLRRY